MQQLDDTRNEEHKRIDVIRITKIEKSAKYSVKGQRGQFMNRSLYRMSHEKSLHKMYKNTFLF